MLVREIIAVYLRGMFETRKENVTAGGNGYHRAHSCGHVVPYSLLARW